MAIPGKLLTRSSGDDVLGIVLVDMQDRFLGRISAKARKELIDAQIEVIKECAERDLFIAILEYHNDGSTVPELRKAIAKVPRTTTLQKLHDDGFYESMLHKILGAHGISTILFMGINTKFCVKKTAESAIRLGYKVSIGRNLSRNTCPCCNDDEGMSWFAQNGSLYA